MRGAWRKLLFTVLVLAVLVALAYQSRNAINLENFSGERLWDAVKGTRKDLLFGSLVAIYAAYALRAGRWKRFCRYLGPVTFSGVYDATLMGFAGVFLLGRAGEPVRPLLLARKCRLPILSMFGIYILERLFDVAATVAIVALSLLVSSGAAVGDNGWQVQMRTTGGLLLAGLAAAVVFIVYYRWHGAGALERRMAAWRQSNNWRRRAAAHFSSFSDGLQAIRNFSDLAAAVFYSTLHWGMVVLVVLLILHSFGGPLAALDLRAAMIVLGFTLVGSTLQLPGVGGGAQVASFIALTQIHGIDPEPAAAAAILLWLISFGGACLAGGPLLVREGWSLGELRRLARAEAQAKKAGTHADGIAAAETLPLPRGRGDSVT